MRTAEEVATIANKPPARRGGDARPNNRLSEIEGGRGGVDHALENARMRAGDYFVARYVPEMPHAGVGIEANKETLARLVFQLGARILSFIDVNVGRRAENAQTTGVGFGPEKELMRGSRSVLCEAGLK